MIDFEGGRIEERGFLHKRISKFAGGLIRTGLSFAGAAGIPGVSAAARFTRSILRGGSRSPAFVRAQSRQLQRGELLRQKRAQGQLIAVTPAGVVLAQGQTGGAGTRAIAAAPGDACPKGHHANRSDYFLRDGTFVPEGSRCVKNRRRNNDNGRAAMRAARRLLGRKKSQDTIDAALSAFAPRSRRKTPTPKARSGPVIVTST